MIRKNKVIIILAIVFIAVFMVAAFSSCAMLRGEPRYKKDCQGTKHTRQAGGYYL